MIDRITIALFITIIVILPGILSIIKPEMMYKRSGTYVYPNKPSKTAVKGFKTGGYVSVTIGVFLIIVALLGGFKGT
ncbi:hypothetical protein [Paenibacillus sp. MY03]|uniref:hypothetical protein n=1 Tax=Paenibacillus sp. MY03 TaxID=302980 RepID=UPI00117FB3A7|nr:hypothetical protein [Paenibacillus sp. MY03]